MRETICIPEEVANLENKRLYKSVTDRKIAGVCGGVAKYFGIDPNIVRIVWLVIMLCYGTGLLLYIAAALVLSDDPNEMKEKYNSTSDIRTETVVNVSPEDVEIVSGEENDS